MREAVPKAPVAGVAMHAWSIRLTGSGRQERVGALEATARPR
jgi:hypothetical protein